MNTQVMDRLLPEDSVVGSWDAGVIGYFSRFPVVNLDGLVNSYNYMRARKEGTEAAFYQRCGITHFANVLPANQRIDALLFEGSPHLYPSIEHRFILYSAEPPPETLPSGFDRSAKFWERMGPHFDYESESIAVIVDGNMAQAFARDCASDSLAVWFETRGDGTVASAWTRTQTGLCVTAAVLPRQYALPPVRVETMSISDYLILLTGGSPPVIRSDWDVYLVGNSLIYVKEPCIPEDAEPRFFLHLDPVDMNDLSSYRKQYGYDNLDFFFRDHRFIKREVCIARRELPDYAIAAIRTGQYTGEGPVWEGNFDVAEPADAGKAAP